MIKKNYKYILTTIFIISFQSLTYFLGKLTPIKPTVLGSVIDSKIPFIPFFIYFYIFWYAMVFFIPLLFALKDINKFSKYITTLFICSLTSFFIFFIFPTTMERSTFEINGVTTFLVSLIYKIDTPVLNCFPSMHCLISFLFIFISIESNKINTSTKTLIIILSTLVILSTFFVKQHVLSDAISACIIASLVYVIVSKTKINEKVFRKLKID